MRHSEAPRFVVDPRLRGRRSRGRGISATRNLLVEDLRMTFPEWLVAMIAHRKSSLDTLQSSPYDRDRPLVRKD